MNERMPPRDDIPLPSPLPKVIELAAVATKKEGKAVVDVMAPSSATGDFPDKEMQVQVLCVNNNISEATVEVTNAE